jgi:hypothetical protein
MVAAALTPRVRIMAICNRVRESTIEAGVFDLKGVRQGITASAFPFVPERLWLFVLLSSPRAGEFPCYVRVINEQTDRAVFYSYMEPRPEFDAHGGVSVHRVPLQFAFPEAGLYTVQVCFFQKERSDVLKGEMPFTVASGDDKQ